MCLLIAKWIATVGLVMSIGGLLGMILAISKDGFTNLHKIPYPKYYYGSLFCAIIGGLLQILAIWV